MKMKAVYTPMLLVLVCLGNSDAFAQYTNNGKLPFTTIAQKQLTAQKQSVVYLDCIVNETIYLEGPTAGTPRPTHQEINVMIDTDQAIWHQEGTSYSERLEVSPLEYGVSFTSSTTCSVAARTTINRSTGAYKQEMHTNCDHSSRIETGKCEQAAIPAAKF